MGNYCTYNIRRCYSLCEQFNFIDTWETVRPYFGEILQTALFLQSSVTVYQTATSKTITYLTTTFDLSWGEVNTTLL